MSLCKNLISVKLGYQKFNLKVPPSLTSFSCDSGLGEIDFSCAIPSNLTYFHLQEKSSSDWRNLIKNLNGSVSKFDNRIYANKEKLEDYSFIGNNENLVFEFTRGLNISQMDFQGIDSLTKLKSITLKFYGSGTINNLKEISNSNLEELYIYGKNDVTSLADLSDAEKLNKLKINDSKITDVSFLNKLINIKYLDLSNNDIVDISSLSKLENIDMKNNNNVKEKFNLSNNILTNLTPLSKAIGRDGIINYTELDVRNNSLDGYTVADNISALLKLHAAGLQKVYITGNNFSENEIQELINGKTIDGVSYSGFGSGNVIN